MFMYEYTYAPTVLEIAFPGIYPKQAERRTKSFMKHDECVQTADSPQPFLSRDIPGYSNNCKQSWDREEMDPAVAMLDLRR